MKFRCTAKHNWRHKQHGCQFDVINMTLFTVGFCVILIEILYITCKTSNSSVNCIAFIENWVPLCRFRFFSFSHMIYIVRIIIWTILNISFVLSFAWARLESLRSKLGQSADEFIKARKELEEIFVRKNFSS